MVELSFAVRLTSPIATTPGTPAISSTTQLFAIDAMTVLPMVLVVMESTPEAPPETATPPTNERMPALESAFRDMCLPLLTVAQSIFATIFPADQQNFPHIPPLQRLISPPLRQRCEAFFR